MTDKTPTDDEYSLKTPELPRIPAPELDYRPPAPRKYSPKIALIGAGGIAGSHLDAYRDAGWDVAIIASRTLESAVARRNEFFPEAAATDDVAGVLSDPSIEVVDLTPHPEERAPLIESAIDAGKHVLSQKPFVSDLEEGERLASLAEDRGVKLAVNQNGRWSPHMAWMRNAVRSGLIGTPVGVHLAVHWDHSWIADTPFEKIEDLILYDFGIHWFDFLISLVGDRARSVRATKCFGTGQAAKVALFAQCIVELEGGQASLVFDGGTKFVTHATAFVGGTEGSLSSRGPDFGSQGVTLTTENGIAEPALEGSWFNDGFRGAMGELLSAIEDDRTPVNGVRENIESLRLTFAAAESSRTGQLVSLA
ncbi:MAG: Gfo/Idh/MocA family oxidoreductase [Albidovulum sp.]|nr:Gfo/Idh/MocA family oxidoreductase [Albidovulum sp.]